MSGIFKGGCCCCRAGYSRSGRNRNSEPEVRGGHWDHGHRGNRLQDIPCDFRGEERVGASGTGAADPIFNIEGYTVSRNMHDEIPEMPDETWDGDGYLYRPGSAIVPGKTVKNGNIYRNGMGWAMLCWICC